MAGFSLASARPYDGFGGGFSHSNFSILLSEFV
jgi:hypothetical protein